MLFYPTLSRFTEQYMQIPATSTSSKRAFLNSDKLYSTNTLSLSLVLAVAISFPQLQKILYLYFRKLKCRVFKCVFLVSAFLSSVVGFNSCKNIFHLHILYIIRKIIQWLVSVFFFSDTFCNLELVHF